MSFANLERETLNNGLKALNSYLNNFVKKPGDFCLFKDENGKHYVLEKVMLADGYLNLINGRFFYDYVGQLEEITKTWKVVYGTESAPKKETLDADESAVVKDAIDTYTANLEILHLLNIIVGNHQGEKFEKILDRYLFCRNADDSAYPSSKQTLNKLHTSYDTLDKCNTAL